MAGQFLAAMRSPLASVFVVFFVIALPMSAAAQSWQQTFAKDRLPAELAEHKLMVISADASADAVARVMLSSLREAGAPAVLDDKALGDVSELSDEAIVAKASHLPVARLILVRSVDMGAGESTEPQSTASSGPEAAVVTIYDRQGRSIAGFFVKRGDPLSEEQFDSHSRGVSQKTVDATVEAVEGEQTERTDTDAPSPPRELSLEETAGSLYLRDGEQWFGGEDIYRHLGRDDLADQYVASEDLRTNWSIGSGVVTTVGVGTAITGLIMAQSAVSKEFDEHDEMFDECGGTEYVNGRYVETHPRAVENCRENKRWEAIEPDRNFGLTVGAVGLGLAVAGGVTWAVVASGSDHPISRAELEALVAEKMRDEGGEQQVDEPSAEQANVEASLSVEFGTRSAAAVFQVHW